MTCMCGCWMCCLTISSWRNYCYVGTILSHVSRGPVWYLRREGRWKNVYVCVYYGGRDSYCMGGWGKMGYYYYYRCILWRKGPVLYGRMGKDGVLLSLLYTIGGRDLYCTGKVRRRCYDICIMHSYKRLWNRNAGVIQMYSCYRCVGAGTLWVC